MRKNKTVILKGASGESSFYLKDGKLQYVNGVIDANIPTPTYPLPDIKLVYYLEYVKPSFGDYTYDEFTDKIVLVVTSESRFKNRVVLTNDKKIGRKNSTPTSYHDNEDLCPSCYSPVNIDKDLDDKDQCNLCRNEPGPVIVNLSQMENICSTYNSECDYGLKVDSFVWDDEMLTGGTITLKVVTDEKVERQDEFYMVHLDQEIYMNLISMKVSANETELSLRLPNNRYLLDLTDFTNEDIFGIKIYVK